MEINRPAVQLFEQFVEHPDELLAQLVAETEWDERMRARLTASFGVPYNYSGMSYPPVPMPPALTALCHCIEARVGYRPNNCLVNYYRTGDSTMGFHSDSIAELEPGTGVAVVSLGAERVLRFRQIADKSVQCDYSPPPGSLLYMPPEVQLAWKHGVPEQPGSGPRISLTFRQLAGHEEPEG
ncbi:MAG: alpha-ketoglutarate-dependent dioxygenase AlkB family protein [Armatimonadota bacterium]